MSTEGALMPQIRLLVQVDQLDRAILRVNTEREEIRQQVRNAKAEIERLGQELAAAESRHKELIGEQEGREERLRWAEDKLSRLRTGSVAISSEKEYDAAQREVESLLLIKAELEDAILAGLEEQEELSGRLESLRTQLEAGKRAYATQQPEWRARFDALGEELEAFRRDRLSLLPEMSSELREAYDRAMHRYKDRAVTTILDGKCPLCRISVPPQHVIEVLMGKALHHCDSCKRLILPAEGL